MWYSSPEMVFAVVVHRGSGVLLAGARESSDGMVTDQASSKPDACMIDH